MTKEEAKEFDTFQYNGDMDYIKESSVSQRIDKIFDYFENRSCNSCKYHLSDNGNYPLHPCCECSRFFIDSWEPKG